MKKVLAVFCAMGVLLVFNINSFVKAEENENPLISWTESQYGTSGLMREVSSKEDVIEGERSLVYEGITGNTGTYNYLYSTLNLTTRNCYGYAIGVNQKVNPGFLCGISVSSYEHDAYLLQTAVIGDLNALGHTNAHAVSSTYTPASGETLIAFRMGYSSGDFVDYHFMIWNTSGYWLHKPGTTAILRYKNTSLTSPWVPEAYISGGWYIDTSFTYNGTTLYVAF